ncbi:MAG: nucleotidyl transferase AbiEii/AbiGii toxin family protein [Bradymonadaceae bacterium]|nr:nucleotidyl transferase AbiEii/AbiGii toxin family protein [Lujinxingiaceae bacterium]
MTSELFETLEFVADTLAHLGEPWALIGGLAVSVHVEPRFTRDIDVAVAIDDDAQAEEFIRLWSAAGFVIETVMEQDAVERLATVRSFRRGAGHGIVVDLLFASSGIEAEIAAAALRLEVVPALIVPVARPAHLIALKLLAVDPDLRPQDAIDLKHLAAIIDANELHETRLALRLITSRGYDRGRDLEALFTQYLTP